MTGQMIFRLSGDAGACTVQTTNGDGYAGEMACNVDDLETLASDVLLVAATMRAMQENRQ